MAETKHQGTFFDVNDQPEEKWAYVVEMWYSPEMNDAMGRDPRDTPSWETVPRPNHFRLETDAVLRAEELSKLYKRPIELQLVVFRVSPKYVGYVPPEDETWIQ